MECAGHKPSEIEKMRDLLRGLPPVFDITARTVMDNECNYH